MFYRPSERKVLLRKISKRFYGIDSLEVLALGITVICIGVIPFLVHQFNAPRLCWMIGKNINRDSQYNRGCK